MLININPLYDKIIVFSNNDSNNNTIISLKDGFAIVTGLSNFVDENVQNINNKKNSIFYNKIMGVRTLYTTKTMLLNPSYPNMVKRGMRKAASNTILNISQKQGISSYLYGFIDNVIDKTKKKEDILPNVIEYFKDNSLGELVLKQTITKGFFPKLTFFKKEALTLFNTTPKISLEDINEKVDVKFLPEIFIANHFANSQKNIQGIVMNSENPKNFPLVVAKTSYSGGNYVKDLTLQISTTSSSPMIMEMDIKSGNNAYTIPGVIGPAPILSSGLSDMVVCDKIIDLEKVNNNRLLFVQDIYIKGLIKKETMVIIESINMLPYEKIHRNIMIQDELLKIISTGITKTYPSFFVGYQVTKKEIELLFFKKMDEHINVNNFNSKKDFEILARHGLKAYYESIIEADRSKIFNKDLFRLTGFDQINVENLFN